MLDGLPEHKDEWLGFRPTLPDFLPIIGPSKNYKNVLQNKQNIINGIAHFF
mgnify:CR=1 FL=1